MVPTCTRATVLKVVAAACAIGMLTACGGSGDEPYPSDNITYVVPYSPGGSTDPLAREFARGLEEQLGVTVAVENREGGSGTIGTTHMLRSDPDGYTLGQATNAVLAQQPLLNDLSFNTPDDYHVIKKIAYLPTVIAVPSDSPHDTLEELLSYAEENPGDVQISQAGAMTGADIALQELMAGSGLDLQSVPFASGGGEAYLAAVGGRVDATAGYTPGLAGFVDSGDLKVIGVLSDEPYEAFPEAQTITDAGYEATYQNINYVLAPKDLPEDVVKALDEASEKILAGENMKTFADDNGYVLDPLGNEEAEAELREYQDRFKKIGEFIEANN